MNHQQAVDFVTKVCYEHKVIAEEFEIDIAAEVITNYDGPNPEVYAQGVADLLINIIMAEEDY